VLADLADCILIFPESAGSYAELGFFAAHSAITQKTLAVNKFEFQAQDSFISLGPLAAINRYSDYSPTLLAADDAAQTHADIARRLERLTANRRRQHFPYHAIHGYSLKHKFFIVFEVLRLLRVIHAATLPHALN